MLLNFSTYIKCVISHAIDINISKISIANALLSPIVQTTGLQSDSGEAYYLNKTRVSNIYNQKEDVPSKIRLAIPKVAEAKAVDIFFGVINENVLCDDVPLLVDDIRNIVNNDKNLPQNIKARLEAYSGDDFEYLFYALIEALKVDNTIRHSKIWENGCNSLNFLVSDILEIGFDTGDKRRKIVVIPVNTSFETSITVGDFGQVQLVSEVSLHGKWLNSIYSKKVEQSMLDSHIKESLSALNAPTHKSASNVGKQVCYPIGTVAAFTYGDTIFYLWAISEFDDKNRAQSSSAQLVDALTALLEYYDTYGQGYEMYVPLVGTGRSRVHLSHQQSYEMIRDAILQHKEKIQGKITIVTIPDDAKQITNL